MSGRYSYHVGAILVGLVALGTLALALYLQWPALLVATVGVVGAATGLAAIV